MWKPLLACAAIALASIPLHAQAPAAGRAEAGWQALQAGDGGGAAAVFREGLTRDPRHATLPICAGIAAHLPGLETDAVQSLRRSAAILAGAMRFPVKGAAQGLHQFDGGRRRGVTDAVGGSLATRGVPGWLAEGLAGHFGTRGAALAARRLEALGVVIRWANLQGG